MLVDFTYKETSMVNKYFNDLHEMFDQSLRLSFGRSGINPGEPSTSTVC